jgi:NADH:ubiquinone reductase (H+-translocating)
MGNEACQVIEKALKDLGIEARAGISVAGVDASGVRLPRVIASPRQRWSGVPAYTRTPLPGRSRANAIASALLDDVHASVMSCQYGRPMGRFAGHNVICDVLAQPMLPLRIEWYVTVLDWGAWGAVYTEGWDRRVVSTGEAAKKQSKRSIVKGSIRPFPGDRRGILEAAAPVTQAAPQVSH